MNAQFKRGVLELCVLALLHKQDCYGFELVSMITESVHMSEGTVYPLLRRIRDEKLVETYLQESSEGPARKYYRLTESGRKKCRELAREWRDFSAGVNQLIEEVLTDDGI